MKKCKPCLPLVVKDNIKIEVPKNKWIDPETVKSLVQDKKKNLKGMNIGFHPDISILGPKETALLQIIDDNGFHGLRRSNILNSNFQNVSISMRNIDRHTPTSSKDKSLESIQSKRKHTFVIYSVFA